MEIVLPRLARVMTVWEFVLMKVFLDVLKHGIDFLILSCPFLTFESKGKIPCYYVYWKHFMHTNGVLDPTGGKGLPIKATVPERVP